MARNKEYINKTYRMIVSEIENLKKNKGIQVTKSSKHAERECAIGIIADKYGYTYWHVYNVYYRLYKND